MQTELLTYQDLADDLLDYFGESRGRREKRIARRAARDAYRFLCGRHTWSVYRTISRIATVAPYETGTVTFDYTGGSSERLVTLSDGTFPSWTKYASLTISSRPYHIETRIDDTTATLTSALNPGADVSATSYSLGRDTFSLPVNCRTVGRLRDVVDGYVLQYVDPEDWLEVTRGFTSTSTPTHYTIVGEPENYSSMAIKVAPMPDAEYIYDFFYDRAPEALRTLNDATEGGTVTTSGTTVTASAAVFKSHHVGSVIRFGDTSDEPTGFGGENPYAAQRVITAVTDTKNATIDSALDDDLASVYYSLSNPLDIDTGSMYSALAAEARLRYAKMARLAIKDSGVSVGELTTDATFEYLEAKGMDFRDTSDAYMGPQRSIPTEAQNHPFIVSSTET